MRGLQTFLFQRLQLDWHLDRAFAALAKDLVRLSDVVQRKHMCEKWRQIEPPMEEEFHQPTHSLTGF